MTLRNRAAITDRLRLLCVLLGLGALVLGGLSTPAAAARSAGNPKYASIVMDANTGAIISESHADKTLHPASLVKIMTLLMTFEALENGTLRLRDPVPISRHAASMVPSKLGLAPGSSIRVEDAIYALVTKSANDIAVALAEKVGGTESNFANMMTRRAQTIGMRNSRFYNASGLHNPRQVSTARDMATLSRYILHRYPQYYHYFSTKQFSYRGVTHRNHNRLMESYAGMDGFKTGFIQPSGFNLVASAKRGDRRLIGVVFGGRTTASRNSHMAVLLDTAFARGGSTDVRIASVAPIQALAAAPRPSRKPANGAALQVATLSAPTATASAVAAVRIPADALPPRTAPVRPATPAAATAAAAKTDPAAAQEAARLAQMNEMLQGSLFQDMIGQGDYDPAVTKRLETGLMAIASLRQKNGEQPARMIEAAYAPPAPPAAAAPQGWSVQIGAYSSRAKTDRALQKAQLELPSSLPKAAPIIVPLKTADGGWVFRGRLSGYASKEEAEAACRFLKDCLPVSPQAY